MNIHFDKNATSINLSDRGLTHIPHEIFECKKLKHLYLDGNNIEKIPDKIGELTNLRVLDIRNNAIDILPEEMCKLKKLQYLFVQNNELTDISDSILKSFPDLREFNSLDNPIHDVVEGAIFDILYYSSPLCCIVMNISSH